MSVASAVLTARAVKARLWNPPNAVPDTGFNFKSGRPISSAVPCTWRKPLLWESKRPYIWPGNLSGEFWLSDEFQPQERRPRIIREIIAAVSEVFGVARNDLCSVRRTENLVRPRHVTMALCRRLTTNSLPQIGRQLGGRDHTTVLHGCRKMQPHIEAIAIEFGDLTCPWAWARAMKARLG